MEHFDCSPQRYATFPHWVWRQLFERPQPVLNIDLTGKVAIVTGSNQGIGIEIVDQLLALKLEKLIMGVRNETEGRAAANLMETRYNLAPGSIEVWKLDMLDYASITSFSQRARDLECLDVVILNAGILRTKMVVNKSTGHEEDIQTNYISTVLLALLLMPTLKAKKRSPTSPGRLTIVSSDTAGMTNFIEQDAEPLIDALDSQGAYKWDMFERYGTSKLLGQLFITELSKHVSPSTIIINAANPGLCSGSSLSRDAEGLVFKTALAIYFGIFGRKLAVGAHVVLNAALEQGEGSHGQLIDSNKIRPMAQFVYSPKSPEVTRRLWNETMEEFAFVDIHTIIRELWTR